jgi:hypothetical protein
MSGTIRSSIPILIDRQLARVWPFTYVVVGNSLAAAVSLEIELWA